MIKTGIIRSEVAARIALLRCVNAEAEKLAKLFPNYVSVRDREYETSLRRKEVNVRWQKALKDGRSAASKTKSVPLVLVWRNTEQRRLNTKDSGSFTCELSIKVIMMLVNQRL